MWGIIVFKLYTLHKGLFFFTEKNINRRTGSTNKSLFSTSQSLSNGSTTWSPPLHQEGGDDEEEDKEEKGEGEKEEEEEDEILKSHIKSIEKEIEKLCQGMLFILYYCALYITERFT